MWGLALSSLVVKTYLLIQGLVGSIPGWGNKDPTCLITKNQNINNRRSNIAKQHSIKTLKMVQIRREMATPLQ